MTSILTATEPIQAWKMAILEPHGLPIVIECRLPVGTRYMDDNGDIKSDRQEYIRVGIWDKNNNFNELQMGPSHRLRSGIMLGAEFQTEYNLGELMYDNWLKDKDDDKWQKSNRGLWACTNPQMSQLACTFINKSDYDELEN